MELQDYTRLDCAVRFVDKATIHFTKTGMIGLNKCAVEKLELKANGKVMLHQDKSKPVDWYLSKTDSEFGFILRQSSTSLCFNANLIAKKLFKSVGIIHGTSITFTIAKEPVEEKYFAIITKSAKS